MSEVENMVDAIEKLVDKKIANAMRGGSSTVPATYMGTDSEGKAWVVLAGADAATPVRRTSVEAARGDMVSVTVSDGMAVIDANLTDKSAGMASVAKADEKAVVAQETAVEAINYASQASAAAGAAQSSASTAYAAAQTAQASADSAVADAARANEAADSAQESADKAIYALSDVEKVVGTVNWIADHGRYELTEDTTVNASKVYYTRSGTSPDYTYEVVSDPKDSELSTYYELTVNESVQNYLASHIWLDNYGLNLSVDSANGFRIHQGTVDGTHSAGTYIIDPNGYIVAGFGAHGSTIGNVDSGNYLDMDDDSFSLYNNNIEKVHFGYGPGTNDEGGVSIAPYYTLGQRVPNSTIGNWSVAEGSYSIASGCDSHAEGSSVEASGRSSHAEGGFTVASGDWSHAEGSNSKATHLWTHAEGYLTTASGDSSHAEGYSTTASGMHSHSEGFSTTASQSNAHSEGFKTTASGDSSHAEGQNSTASSSASHAEGADTEASGIYSHAEGKDTTASGGYTHAEGSGTTASGSSAHAEGKDTTASGAFSHAEGQGTIAATSSQHVEGKFNVKDTSAKYAHIIGNGTDDNNRSNALTVDWDGKVKMGQVLGIHSQPSSSAVIDTSTNNGATSSAEVFGRTEIMDKNGTWVSTYGSNTQTNGQTRSYIGCNNMKTDGTMATNYLNIGVNKDGSAYYAMTSPTAFCTALGYETTTTASDFITPSTGITVTSAAFARWGKVAQVLIRFTCSSGISVPASGNIVDVDVGTISIGKRPFTTASLVSWGNNVGFAQGYINSSGIVKLCGLEGTGAQRTVAAGTAIDLTATYILA